MPDIFYTKLEEVPEEWKADAKDSGDGRLVVKAVSTSKLTTLNDDVVKLRRTNNEISEKLAKAVSIFGTEDFEEATRTFTELRDVSQRVKDKQLVESTSLQDAVEKRIAETRAGFETQLKKERDEASDWKKRAGEIDSRYKRSLVDQAVTNAVLAEGSGVDPKATGDIMRRAHDIFSAGDDGKIVARDGDVPLLGSNGDPLTVTDWIGTKLKSEVPYYFLSSRGGGASGGGEKKFGGRTEADFMKLPAAQRLAIANGATA